eukprot:scaffold14018_cov118-Isochrysis_galbana.AAC.4
MALPSAAPVTCDDGLPKRRAVSPITDRPSLRSLAYRARPTCLDSSHTGRFLARGRSENPKPGNYVVGRRRVTAGRMSCSIKNKQKFAGAVCTAEPSEAMRRRRPDLVPLSGTQGAPMSMPKRNTSPSQKK